MTFFSIKSQVQKLEVFFFGKKLSGKAYILYMVDVEKKLFEDVLAQTGFSIKSNDNGLYLLGHKYSQKEEYVQTNGYNLLESLRRLTTSDLAKDALR